MSTSKGKRSTTGGSNDSHTLLIVESPAKAKTIKGYLGKGYSVASSVGHLIDLPRSRMAVDVENGFEPEYITVRGKAKFLRELVSQATKVDRVLLASDNDREGEAISYHLRNVLIKKKPKLQIERIIFNEITPVAIKSAISSPREIDEPKVNAQKARRVLDRLVGYNLSPLLWKKVKGRLSAGRVQSVALWLICEREKEVEAFIPTEYWTLEASLRKGKKNFLAELVKLGGEKAQLRTEAEVNSIVSRVTGKPVVVTGLKQSERKSSPKAPYTTSTLQQEASSRLNFSSRKTMQIAQQLYEGIAIGRDQVGLISYMRTDSTRISEQAIEEVRTYIGEHFPAALPESPRSYKNKKGAQDAHEAIRPTSVVRAPAGIKEFLTRDQFRLYSVIWERFLSSQMINATNKITTAEFTVEDAVFRTTASEVVEPGFLHALNLLKPKVAKVTLPKLSEGDEVEVDEFHPEQHYTSGPPRFTDASIVKLLEEKGIGRPSTYAPIISVLLDRYYVVRQNKQLVPTTLGRIIVGLLGEQFPRIVEVDFTAELERQLDQVEEESIQWQELIRQFYEPFIKQVEHVNDTMESIKGVLDEPVDELCEKCNRPMVKKLGKYGFFIACTGFPECRNSKAIPLADCPLPDCDGSIVERKAKGRGSLFGCTNYPDCRFMSYYRPSSHNCPGCGWFLVERADKKRGDYKACINPDCDFRNIPHEGEGEQK